MDLKRRRIIKFIINRIFFALSVLLFLFVFYQYIHAQNRSKGVYSQIKLDEVLKETRAYCRRLQNAALDFVCLEEIFEKIDFTRDYSTLLPEIRKNSFVYDYQFIRKDNRTKEARILLEENGIKKYEEDADLKTSSFRYQSVLFGPVGLLGSVSQQSYDYKIVDEELLDGDKTVIVEAVPKENQKHQYLPFGKIWVKQTDFSILKIEWNQKTVQNFPEVEKIAKRYKAEPNITLITEFGFEKNRIRFPSKYIIIEAYISQKGKIFIRSKTTVVYRDYKFFTVETEVKH